MILLSGCGRFIQVMDGDGMEYKPTYAQISQDEAKLMMQDDDGHVIVDVRRADEYAKGHIPGAILIPNEEIGTEPPAELPDKTQVILVYCRTGRRSKEAAGKLADMGYVNVYEFGGIEDWTGDVVVDWIDSITDENGVYIGQEKEVVGYYKRTGIAKIDGTYEEMLDLRDKENQGYLVVNDDGTASFELNGEKTEYVFDGRYFYLSEDTERANGFRYTCINGRLIINDGETITQYLRVK